jgi:hypothetical protein
MARSAEALFRIAFSSCPAKSAKRVFALGVPGIHVLSSSSKKNVDGRDIGKRKRRRPSDDYARP